MLDRSQLEEALDFQQRSYQLLLWLSKAVPRGFISFDTAHDYASCAESARAWIEEHFDNLPQEGRPQRHQVEPDSLLQCHTTYPSLRRIAHGSLRLGIVANICVDPDRFAQKGRTPRGGRGPPSRESSYRSAEDRNQLSVELPIQTALSLFRPYPSSAPADRM